jgi:hypothetical protein
MLIECIDQAAKVYPQRIQGEEVVYKVVQNPVPEGNKSAYADDAPKVILPIYGPLQPREEIGGELAGSQERAECQEEIREQFIVEEARGGNVGNQSRRRSGQDIPRRGEAYKSTVLGIGCEGIVQLRADGCSRDAGRSRDTDRLAYSVVHGGTVADRGRGVDVGARMGGQKRVSCALRAQDGRPEIICPRCTRID